MQSICTINGIFQIRIGLDTNVSLEECLKAHQKEQR